MPRIIGPLGHSSSLFLNFTRTFYLLAVAKTTSIKNRRRKSRVNCRDNAGSEFLGSFFVRSAIYEMNVHGSKLAALNSVEGAMNIAVKPVCVADGEHQGRDVRRIRGSINIRPSTTANRRKCTLAESRIETRSGSEGTGRTLEEILKLLSVFLITVSTTINYYLSVIILDVSYYLIMNI